MLKSRYMCHTMTIHNTMSLSWEIRCWLLPQLFWFYRAIYTSCSLLYFITVGERSSGRREVCFHCKTDDVETSSYPVYIVTKGKW